AFEYNVDLFDASTILRMAERFVRLVEEVGEASSRHLSELLAMDSIERQQLLLEWNDTAGPAFPIEPEVARVHDLILVPARRTPEATAVVFGDESLTYGEMEQRARRIAGYLQ